MAFFTLGDVNKLIHLYKSEHTFRKSLYSTRNVKPFINRPFPPDVSENLVRCFVEQVERRQCNWTVDANHDLFLPTTKRKLEVKAFTNEAEQVSFTCTQDFDVLYVLDCRKFTMDVYVVHIFEFSSEEMKAMEVGMDCVATRFLKEEKRTVRVTLKKLKNFAKVNGFYHEVHSFKLNEQIQIVSEH